MRIEVDSRPILLKDIFNVNMLLFWAINLLIKT